MSGHSHAFPPVPFDQDSGVLGSGPPSRTTATRGDSPSISSAAGRSPSDSFRPLLPGLAVANPSPTGSPLATQTTFPSTLYPVTGVAPGRRSYGSDVKPESLSSNLAPSQQPGQPPSILHSDSQPNSNNGVAVTLTQVSQDVNRILSQLGHLRITPGEVIDETHPIMDEITPAPATGGQGGRARGDDDEMEPPEYGENDGTIPPGVRALNPHGP